MRCGIRLKLNVSHIMVRASGTLSLLSGPSLVVSEALAGCRLWLAIYPCPNSNWLVSGAIRFMLGVGKILCSGFWKPLIFIGRLVRLQIGQRRCILLPRGIKSGPLRTSTWLLADDLQYNRSRTNVSQRQYTCQATILYGDSAMSIYVIRGVVFQAYSPIDNPGVQFKYRCCRSVALRYLCT